MKDVWVITHSNGTRHTVRYGGYALAHFNRKELAEAYRDWIWARRGWANPNKKYSLEHLIEARHARRP